MILQAFLENLCFLASALARPLILFGFSGNFLNPSYRAILIKFIQPLISASSRPQDEFQKIKREQTANFISEG